MGVIRGFGLNPCPICGSRSIEIQDGQTLESVTGQKAMTARVRCRDCRFKIDYQFDRETAKAKWNAIEDRNPKYIVHCYVRDEGKDAVQARTPFDRTINSPRSALEYMVETSDFFKDGKECFFKVEVKH